MAQAATKITEVDRVTVWVLTNNYYDALRPNNAIAKRYRVTPGKSIHAEHGLSYYVETTVDGKTGACMFDYGLDPVGVMNNIALLGLDLGKTNAFTLSHGHFDHWSGAAEILKRNQARIVKGTPFYVGDEAFNRRFSLRPGTTEAMDIGQLKKEDIESLGVKIETVKDPTEIIERTVADIKAMKPRFIAPTHCTGFEAITLFRKEMPDEFILNTAGTNYTFAA